ncbi:MAG: biotin--[acetyl-CoA-carboxylase] ligase [Chitinophagaceae bacterium]|nr:biotin--[acetyl-CoA-carboxylase] ligase [Chitinophagaceae bacterium]
MSSNVKDVLQAPILRFDILDSTNNRAAQLIDADTSVEGLTIITREQSAGKGQRGNTWKDEAGLSLLMSIVLQPRVSTDAQFSFSAAVAVAVADALSALGPDMDVRIKFPNDIIINDKKAAGILIENAFRGSSWTHAIVGIGINVLQQEFTDLPHATSLLRELRKRVEPELVLQLVRQKVVEYTRGSNLEYYRKCYNLMLYRQAAVQRFSEQGVPFDAIIVQANAAGQLELQLEEGNIKAYHHGEVSWIWP